MSKEADCDSVFVVGGGSALDTAKVIAAAITDGRALSKLVGVLKVKTPPLPCYAAPTTSGTGSEVTAAAVISDTETHAKKFFVDPKYVPMAAALDPELLKSLPPHITAATGMDALTHAIEAYTSLNNFDDTDRDARLAIKLLVEFLPVAYENGHDLKARERVAQGAFLAGYAFTKSSLGYVHALSHQLSARYGTPHGLANAVLLPPLMRFNRPAVGERFAQLEDAITGTRADDRDAAAEGFVERIRQLCAVLGIPSHLEALQEEDFDELVAGALAEARSSYAVPRRMRRSDARAILASVRGDVQRASSAPMSQPLPEGRAVPLRSTRMSSP